jgi:hypothetical protein
LENINIPPSLQLRIDLFFLWKVFEENKDQNLDQLYRDVLEYLNAISSTASSIPNILTEDLRANLGECKRDTLFQVSK